LDSRCSTGANRGAGRFGFARCRRISEQALRDWAQGELAAGHMTIAEIKREPAAAVPRSGVIRPSGEPRALPQW